METEGGSIFSEIYRHLKGAFKATKDVRMNIPPKSRNILSDYGDVKIKEIYVCRRPLQKTLKTILNIMSFISKKTIIHDELYHLFLLCVLEDNKHIVIEKNQEFNVEPYKANIIDELIKVPYTEHISAKSMNILISTTISNIGEDAFFRYNGFSNNCQMFVYNCLHYNNFYIDDKLKAFIMQDIKNLINGTMKTIVNLTTTFGNRLKYFFEGEGLSEDSIDRLYF